MIMCCIKNNSSSTNRYVNESLISLGIGGKPRILDIGSASYLVPIPQKDKLYDMTDFPGLTEMNLKKGDKALLIGAGCAPLDFLRRNAEVSFFTGCYEID